MRLKELLYRPLAVMEITPADFAVIEACAKASPVSYHRRVGGLVDQLGFAQAAEVYARTMTELELKTLHDILREAPASARAPATELLDAVEQAAVAMAGATP